MTNARGQSPGNATGNSSGRTCSLPSRLGRFRKILQKIDVHLSEVAIPTAHAPRLGTDVNVTIAIHVADLQLMATELLIENNSYGELAAAEIFPNDPARVLAALWQQFFLLVRHDVRTSIVANEQEELKSAT